MDNSVFDYYHFFTSRIKWLLIVPVIFGVAGVLFASLQNHKYVAELTFVSNSDNNSNPYSLLMQQVGIDLNNTNNAFEGDNLIELLKTRFLIEQTLLTPVSIANKQQLLVDYYMNVYKLKQKWNGSHNALQDIQFTQDRSNFTLLQDSALKLIYKEILPTLTVNKPDKKLSIISVSLTGRDQYWVKYFTETLLANAAKMFIKSKTTKLQENVNILQYKVDSVNGKVSGNLSSIANTQDINVNPTKKTSQISIQEQQINLQVNNAIIVELTKNLELAKIQLSKATPFIQVLDRPILPLDDQKIGRLLSGIIGVVVGGMLTIIFFVAEIQIIKFRKKLMMQPPIQTVLTNNVSI